MSPAMDGSLDILFIILIPIFLAVAVVPLWRTVAAVREGDFSCSRNIAKLLTANLKGGIHRGRLHYLALEFFNGGENLVLGGNVGTLGEHLSCDILGICRESKLKGGSVILVGGEHIFACLNGSSNEHGQNSRRKRIKRSRVSCLGCAKKPLNTVYRSLRGYAFFFFEYYDAALHFLLLASIRSEIVLYSIVTYKRRKFNRDGAKK